MHGVYSLALVSEEYGEFISHAVRTFAEPRNLYYDLWHKDAPLWVITDLDWSKSNIGPRVNKLEVGVFRTDNSLEIGVLPDAYRIETMGQRRCIRASSRQELTQRISFNDFLLTVSRGALDEASEILHSRLHRAWEGTVAIKDEDLVLPSELGRP